MPDTEVNGLDGAGSRVALKEGELMSVASGPMKLAPTRRLAERIRVARSIDWEGSRMGDENVLIFGDSRSYSLRHEVPLAFPDPVAYLEVGGKRRVLAGSVDIPRLTSLAANTDLDVVSFEDLGLREAMSAGKPLSEAIIDALVAACRRFSVSEVSTPADFPLYAADQLRGAGIEVRADAAAFDLRRRRKTPSELEGIRRGLRAAEAAMAAIRDGLRRGDDLTVEQLRTAAQVAMVRHGAVPHDMTIIAPGPQGADQHDQGSGAIAEHVPIVVDVFPRDLQSGCWGDLTRTLCVGEPPESLPSGISTFVKLSAVLLRLFDQASAAESSTRSPWNISRSTVTRHGREAWR